MMIVAVEIVLLTKCDPCDSRKI